MKKIIANLFLIGLTLGFITGCQITFLENSDMNNSALDEKTEKEDLIYDGKWGISSPIAFKDKKYGLINIVGYGLCTYKITDSTITKNNMEEVDNKLRSALGQAFSTAIPKSGDDFYSLMSSKKQIEDEMLTTANAFVSEWIEITSINIQAINLTEESEKIVNQIRRQEILNHLQ